MTVICQCCNKPMSEHDTPILMESCFAWMCGYIKEIRYLRKAKVIKC